MQLDPTGTLMREKHADGRDMPPQRTAQGGEPNRPRVLLAQSPVAAYLSGPPAQTPGAIPDADGAVAQLGERVNGIHEVRGSIPLGSTNKNIDLFQGIGRLMQSRPHCGERSLYHNYITEMRGSPWTVPHNLGQFKPISC